MKIGTVALLVSSDNGEPVLLDILFDDREVTLLETAMNANKTEPVNLVYKYRHQRTREEEDFGDYIEELLSQPFLRPEIQQHGLQWLKSKIRLEHYQKTEADAAKVIAEYAFKLFKEDPVRTDFYLSGPTPQAKIRIRIFFLPSVKSIKAA